MLEKMGEEHPRINLLFYVADEIDDELRNEVKQLIEGLAGSRVWVIGPPELIDHIEEHALESSAAPGEMLGGMLQIYSATNLHELSREIDVAHLHEVEALISAVEKLSKEHELNFEFELDGEFIGEIENGRPDKGLAEGLLGEWRRNLGE